MPAPKPFARPEPRCARGDQRICGCKSSGSRPRAGPRIGADGRREPLCVEAAIFDAVITARCCGRSSSTGISPSRSRDRPRPTALARRPGVLLSTSRGKKCARARERRGRYAGDCRSMSAPGVLTGERRRDRGEMARSDIDRAAARSSESGADEVTLRRPLPPVGEMWEHRATVAPGKFFISFGPRLRPLEAGGARPGSHLGR